MVQNPPLGRISIPRIAFWSRLPLQSYFGLDPSLMYHLGPDHSFGSHFGSRPLPRVTFWVQTFFSGRISHYRVSFESRPLLRVSFGSRPFPRVLSKSRALSRVSFWSRPPLQSYFGLDPSLVYHLGPEPCLGSHFGSRPLPRVTFWVQTLLSGRISHSWVSFGSRPLLRVSFGSRPFPYVLSKSRALSRVSFWSRTLP